MAEERYWHLLLHYRKQWIGGIKSEADGKDFFLSPKGKYDPGAELEATISSFFGPLSEDPNIQHPQCQFPARYAWLKKRLGFNAGQPSEQPCKRFSRWWSKMGAESITVVFADAYLNNPPSMYGHTFLRLNHKDHGPEERLLDYTINFSADTTTQNGLIFAIRGLTGGYPGRFSTTPFYIKVQEYTNLESRDLWEYQLDLTQEQVDRLVMHLWEMGSTYFDYFFLDENCSYQLLPLLEIADPSLHLTESARPWIIPIDTIRTLLDQPNLVVSIERRPSHLNQMLGKRALLSKDEIRLAQDASELMNDAVERSLDQYSAERQALILDTAYDYYRYQVGFRHDQNKESKKLERRILLKRKSLGIQPPPNENPVNPIPPHSGHKTGRIALGFGITRDTPFEEISLRPALHDLEADSTGYIPNSQLEMFHLRLRYDNTDREVFLEELTLLEIISLSPRDPWIREPSWMVNTGFVLARDLNCNPRRCLYYGFNAARGLSIKTHLWREELVYLLAEMDSGIGRVFEKNYRLGAGGRAGLLMHLGPLWTVRLEGAIIRYPLGDVHTRVYGLLNQTFHISKNIGLRLTLKRESSYREALFSFNFYL